MEFLSFGNACYVLPGIASFSKDLVLVLLGQVRWNSNGRQEDRLKIILFFGRNDISGFKNRNEKSKGIFKGKDSALLDRSLIRWSKLIIFRVIMVQSFPIILTEINRVKKDKLRNEYVFVFRQNIAYNELSSGMLKLQIDLKVLLKILLKIGKSNFHLINPSLIVQKDFISCAKTISIVL